MVQNNKHKSVDSNSSKEERNVDVINSVDHVMQIQKNNKLI